MDGSPLHIRGLRLSVDGVTEHVEHPRNDLLTDRHLQGGARVLDRHSPGQTLRGRQGNSPYPTRIKLCHHFDDDLSSCAGAQYRKNRRQLPVKPHIDDAAAHRNDRAAIRRRRFVPYRRVHKGLGSRANVFDR
jgi:hypothetical protein